MPKLTGLLLADAEVVRATLCVTGVFPDGLDAEVEQVDRVAQLEVLDGDVVEVLVEVLDADDLLAERLRSAGVLFGAANGRRGRRLRRRVLLSLLRPELPAVLELWNAHGFEDVIEHGGTACGGGGGGSFGGGCGREVRGGEGGETACHCGGVGDGISL